jgi:hypothetical protein
VVTSIKSVTSGNSLFVYEDLTVSNGIELSIESLRYYFPHESRFNIPDYDIVDFIPELLIAIISCPKKVKNRQKFSKSEVLKKYQLRGLLGDMQKDYR